MFKILKFTTITLIIGLILFLITFKIVHEREVQNLVTLGYSQEIARKKVTVYNFHKKPSELLERRILLDIEQLEKDLAMLGFTKDINGETIVETRNILNKEYQLISNVFETKIINYTTLFDKYNIEYELDTNTLNLKEQVDYLQGVYDTQIDIYKEAIVDLGYITINDLDKNDIETYYNYYRTEYQKTVDED